MKRFAAGWLAGVMMLALAVEQAGAQGALPAGSSYKTSIVIKKIESQKVRTPEYRVSVTPVAVKAPRDWYQITAHYDTHQDWTDELNLVCYVLLRNKSVGQGPKQILLRGEVSLINIPKGKHKYEWYVHPGTMARYGDPEAVGVLINRQGQLVAKASNPPDPKRWWEELTPLSGMVLPRAETPFGFLCVDDFEQTKPATDGAGR